MLSRTSSAPKPSGLQMTGPASVLSTSSFAPVRPVIVANPAMSETRSSGFVIVSTTRSRVLARIADWVAQTFTATEVDGVDVYDLTAGAQR